MQKSIYFQDKIFNRNLFIPRVSHLNNRFYSFYYLKRKILLQINPTHQTYINILTTTSNLNLSITMQYTYFNLFLFTSASFFGQLYAAQQKEPNIQYEVFFGTCLPDVSVCMTKWDGRYNCPKQGVHSCKSGLDKDKTCIGIRHTGVLGWLRDDITYCDTSALNPRDIQYWKNKEEARLKAEKENQQKKQ